MTAMAAAAEAASARCVDAALADIARREGFQRPRFHVEPGTDVGDGYMSAIYRATIQEEDGASERPKLQLVCKTTTPATQGTVAMDTVFKVEGCAYSTLFPAMEELVGLREHQLPWPRSYHVSVAGAPPHCLVLADLRPEGYAMLDKDRALDAQHCRLVLEQLARFHGAGLALRHLRPQQFQAVVDAITIPRAFEEFQEGLRPFLSAARNVPDMLADRFARGGAVHARLTQLFDGFVTDYFTNQMPDPEGGNAIAHGDCHFKNALFQYDPVTGEATACRLIDFQAVHFGVLAPDVAQFLLPYSDRALRAAHWDDLLRGYHRELQATLRAAGCDDPDAIYSWEHFMSQLRRAALHALCMAPVFLHLALGGQDAVKDIQDAVAHFVGGESEDAEDIVDDNDRQDDDDKKKKAAAAATFSVRESPELKERMGDLVQDLLDWGWLLD